jgi:acetyl esterase
MLDPQARKFMQLMADQGVQPMHTLTAPKARAAYLQRRALSQPEGETVAHTHDHVLEHSGISIAVREYRPLGFQANAALPALLFFHGGGWTVGDMDTHDAVCRSLCNASGGAVFSVDYRLGPEAPFPAAYEDALAAFSWLVAQAGTLHIDTARITVGGDSAGGNIAAALCLGLRDTSASSDHGIRPAFQLLIYPAVTMRPNTDSYQRNGQGYMLTQDSMRWYTANYLSEDSHADDWRASPLLATSHANLPAALVITAGFDPLRDEGLQYANALSQAGVQTQYVCFERQIHGFITMGRVIDEAHTALALCGLVLKRHWSGV